MKTMLLDANQVDAVAQAARFLIDGFLVAFPTDTLYGVGASVYDESAIARLYEVKERPQDKGIPILLAETGDIDRVAINIPELARALMSRFWPGPLTLIVPRRESLPAILAPGKTIAVRIPDHPLTQRLIQAAGGAVATSSANLSGQAPARTAAEALAALNGRIAAVVDGGMVPVGRASTIVDCTVSPPRLIRQGPIPTEALLAIGRIELGIDRA